MSRVPNQASALTFPLTIRSALFSRLCGPPHVVIKGSQSFRARKKLRQYASTTARHTQHRHPSCIIFPLYLLNVCDTLYHAMYDRPIVLRRMSAHEYPRETHCLCNCSLASATWRLSDASFRSSSSSSTSALLSVGRQPKNWISSSPSTSAGRRRAWV